MINSRQIHKVEETCIRGYTDILLRAKTLTKDLLEGKLIQDVQGGKISKITKLYRMTDAAMSSLFVRCQMCMKSSYVLHLSQGRYMF
jgi:hypothetical protein